ETMMDETVPMYYAGTFIGVGDGIHDAQGDAYTIPIEDGSYVLRLENFQSTNGPDLFVYLSTDDNASEFVNLGELKANKGNQNYNIPEGTDLQKYDKVLIWCKAFSVLFGSAELSSQ
ncbi:MAG: DM13 domain-containing protein, partial [Nitrosopumilus sp.]